MRLQPGAGGIHASGSTAAKTFAGGRLQHLLLLGAWVRGEIPSFAVLERAQG